MITESEYNSSEYRKKEMEEIAEAAARLRGDQEKYRGDYSEASGARDHEQYEREMDMIVEATALHEAGRAVMASILRMPITYVAIVPDMAESSTEYLGQVVRPAAAAAPKGKKRQADELKREILFNVAGSVAEYYLATTSAARERVQSLWNTSEGITDARRCTARIAPDDLNQRALLNQMIDVAEGLLLLLPYAMAISRLATALVEKRTIQGNEARSIIQEGINEVLAHSSAQECQEFYRDQHYLLGGLPQVLWNSLYVGVDPMDGRPVRMITESKRSRRLKIEHLSSIPVHDLWFSLLGLPDGRNVLRLSTKVIGRTALSLVR